MIVECENCQTRFRLNENLLKETGSKVRCSKCKHAFTAFPPEVEVEIEEAPLEKAEEIQVSSPEETRVVPEEEEEAAPPEEAEDEAPEEIVDESVTSAFDKTLTLDIEEEMEPISIDDLPDFDDELIEEGGAERAEIQTAMGRAQRVEEEIIAQDESREGREMEEVEASIRPRPVVKRKRGSRLWMALVLLLLVLGGGVVALGVFSPDLLPVSLPFFKKPVPKEQTFDLGNKRLSFNDLEGSFVNSNKAGKLFVVKGVVTNMYPDKRSFVRIRSNILDSKRMVVSSKIVFAGNPLSDKELQSLPIEEMENRFRDKFGKNRMNVNILPNASIPFMVVFNNLPEDMSEFTVEAISSSPVGK